MLKTKESLGKKDMYVLHLRKEKRGKHFIFECEPFKDSGYSYINILTATVGSTVI
jgi:hypothetical protein